MCFEFYPGSGPGFDSPRVHFFASCNFTCKCCGGGAVVAQAEVVALFFVNATGIAATMVGCGGEGVHSLLAMYLSCSY
jgi:hypothetical protein